MDPDRIAVLPNPVDLDRVRAAIAEPVDAHWLAPARGPLIVAAGRLADAKNYPLMIDAFAVLCAAGSRRDCGFLDRASSKARCASGLPIAD